MVAKKAIFSSNNEINVSLFDMSKAFDAIQWDTLIKDLQKVFEPDVF